MFVCLFAKQKSRNYTNNYSDLATVVGHLCLVKQFTAQHCDCILFCSIQLQTYAVDT